MRRVQRTAAVLKKELAPLVEETLDKKCGLTTLMDINVQPDLKEAKVYISCLDETYQDEVIKILNNRAKEFQHILGRRLKQKFTPKITFMADRGWENVAKIEELLKEINDT